MLGDRRTGGLIDTLGEGGRKEGMEGERDRGGRDGGREDQESIDFKSKCFSVPEI